MFWRCAWLLAMVACTRTPRITVETVVEAHDLVLKVDTRIPEDGTLSVLGRTIPCAASCEMKIPTRELVGAKELALTITVGKKSYPRTVVVPAIAPHVKLGYVDDKQNAKCTLKIAGEKDESGEAGTSHEEL